MRTNSGRYGFLVLLIIILTACGGGGGGKHTHIFSSVNVSSSTINSESSSSSNSFFPDSSLSSSSLTGNESSVSVASSLNMSQSSLLQSSAESSSSIIGVFKYAIGGTVSGLIHDGLVLQNNAGDDLFINSNGPFNFSTAINNSEAYSVTVKTQPIGQTCSVTQGSGTVNNANITNVTITCGVNSYVVNAKVFGLTGTGLILQNNADNDLAIATNGSFAFSISIASGNTYAVTVKAQPANQICSVINGSGEIINADIVNVSVTCSSASHTVGGTISGLMRNGLVLQNNESDFLSIDSNGPYTFSTSLSRGSGYNVSVKTNPEGQRCFIDNVSGTIGEANITNVSVSCVMISYSLAGTVSGLTGSGLVLQNENGDETVSVSANGPFNFPDIFYNGTAYSVKVKNQPTNQTCSVRSNGTGVITTTNVTNILVVCGPLTVGPVVSVDYNVKSIILSWPAVEGATYYKISKTPDGSQDNLIPLADNLQTTTYTDIVPVHLVDWVNSYYLVSACNDGGCEDSQPISAFSESAIGYFKASNSGDMDRFGTSIAISGDGNTLAVGAIGEASNAVGINGNQSDNSKSGSGAVYVYTRNTGMWTQQAYIKASNTDAGDNFGISVSLSGDGDTLVVGAFLEASGSSDINGNESDNSTSGSGAAYVFVRNSGVWSKQAYLKASNANNFSYFGHSVSLSNDGDLLGVGAYGEASNATGINGNQNDTSKPSSGAVYLFSRNAGIWSQNAYIKASNTDGNDFFGYSIALSGDGSTLAVGAMHESSGALGINGDQGNNNLTTFSGATYVFSNNAGSWVQEAYIKASNTNNNDAFGVAVALSEEGNTLAVGASAEASTARGINGDQNNNARPYSGATYVFSRVDGSWSQQAYIKAPNADGGDQFGVSLALSRDGNSLAVGAAQEASNARGVNGGQASNEMISSGAVYIFDRVGSNWSTYSYIKASNTNINDVFGTTVAISADANTLAVGALFEASNATGIGGDQSDNSLNYVGAVYLY